jgi:hypothetical protein
MTTTLVQKLTAGLALVLTRLRLFSQNPWQVWGFADLHSHPSIRAIDEQIVMQTRTALLLVATQVQFSVPLEPKSTMGLNPSLSGSEVL